MLECLWNLVFKFEAKNKKRAGVLLIGQQDDNQYFSSWKLCFVWLQSLPT